MKKKQISETLLPKKFKIKKDSYLKLFRLLKKWIFDICQNNYEFNISKKFRIIRIQSYSKINCGICGFISIKKKNHYNNLELYEIFKSTRFIASRRFNIFFNKKYNLKKDYLGGKVNIYNLFKKVKNLRKDLNFLNILISKHHQKKITLISRLLYKLLGNEYLSLNKYSKENSINNSFIITNRIEFLEDVSWCLNKELINNLQLIDKFLPTSKEKCTKNSIFIFKQINFTLNSIDRLEVRGRDSAGISIFFILTLKNFKKFKNKLNKNKLINVFINRQKENLLKNKSIHCVFFNKESIPEIAITFTYKIASEIGRLGDNTTFLRQEIKKDQIFHCLTLTPIKHNSISSHTRWASIGSISEQNSHPIDNVIKKFNFLQKNIIHICLNGEIDNYLELKNSYTNMKLFLQKEITTDTKIIPILVEKYINNGFDLISAFRLTVNNFEGSHAITMQTNLAPGKLLIAQKGSGQSMFIGLSKNAYIASSEIYGFVEKTNKFIKINGESILTNSFGKKNQGQIFILDQNSNREIEDIVAIYYDGSPLKIDISNVKYTKITSKDIDRKGFRHYFLKEIYESPSSVTKTLNKRWVLEIKNKHKHYGIKLTNKNIPQKIQQALKKGLIKNIFFIGQGTAGVAANACSNIAIFFLKNSRINISSFKSSEFAIFQINDQNKHEDLKNALVIAITQSGSTSDTNQAIEIAKKKKAFTLAIVNRRDSDITFKVDGILYTSSGRDIEMSVASTKAFYSQIVAGAILGLQISFLIKCRSSNFISNEIKCLLNLPKKMQKVLNIEKIIKINAQKLAGSKHYWATVGSGLNKVSADEIRIKLSELCYKTISSDFIEDKKHIDLSSEPLILVCTAGSNEKLINNIVKNVAIFKAHKATPIVITNEKEERFNPYVESIFFVPKIPEHYAPILNTLVGHIWGYHAALSINEVSKLLSDFRDTIQTCIYKYTEDGFDIFEIIRKKRFITTVDRFYRKLRKKMTNISSPIQTINYSDIILLLKYLSGRLPVSDFEMDFNKKGTASEIFLCFFEKINQLINDMSRPIDAIRHQAKTVTVGSSIINTKLNGILFQILKNYHLKISQIKNKNIIIMKNLQKVIYMIQGTVLYTITKLDSMGGPNAITEIKIQSKSGITKSIPSRVEKDKTLKGTKRLVVTKENIYVGKGRKDGQNVIIVPIRSNISQKTNKIRHLLLLNVVFRKIIPLKIKIKALGEKHNNIKNIVQESSIPWSDFYIDKMRTDDLFGFSAEKIGEYIVSKKHGVPINID